MIVGAVVVGVEDRLRTVDAQVGGREREALVRDRVEHPGRVRVALHDLERTRVRARVRDLQHRRLAVARVVTQRPQLI
ncbi:hypothetical protein CJ026_025805 [Ralstonia pickettii]|nr:hypothetical protein CJ026_025805 [Ralstonia pickettii]